MANQQLTQPTVFACISEDPSPERNNCQRGTACRAKCMVQTGAADAPKHPCFETGYANDRKLLSHQTALHWPTTVQMPHAMVLAAATTKPLWTKRTWKLWVQEQRESGVEPLQRLVQKKRDKARIRKFKRPASTEVRQHKRTPFTLERRAGIKRTGVHRRRPASASDG